MRRADKFGMQALMVKQLAFNEKNTDRYRGVPPSYNQAWFCFKPRTTAMQGQERWLGV